MLGGTGIGTGRSPTARRGLCECPCTLETLCIWRQIDLFLFVCSTITHSYWQCTRDSPSHSHKQRRWVTVLGKLTIINDWISCSRPSSPLLPCILECKGRKNKMLMCPTSLPIRGRGWHSVPSPGRISRGRFPLKPNKRL